MSRAMVVVVLLTAVLFAAVLLVAAPAGASPPYASPTPIAAGAGTQDAPSQDQLAGTLAWEDDASGAWGVSWGLTDWTKSMPADSHKRHPVLQSFYPGQVVVWEDDRNGTWD